MAVKSSNRNALPCVALLAAGLLLAPIAARAAVASNINNTTNSPVLSPAQLEEDRSGPPPAPPTLADLQEQTIGQEQASGESNGLHIRADAIREAALSYGARGGLAFRTFQIQRRLAEYDTSLTKAFDFKRLLVAAPSGFLIEPPIVSAAERAVIVANGGQNAAVADRMYRINRDARIVTASRDWHLYLERDWGRVDPPPSLLLPKDDVERVAWRLFVKEGWEAGIAQAEDTFEADLDRLTEDFVGMVRYRELLAQGMITPPYAVADDRGVTAVTNPQGQAYEMRVGDRGVSITDKSSLIPRSDQWTPAAR